MKNALKLIIALVLAQFALAATAWAASLEDLTFEDQPKKIIVRLLFDEAVSAEVISHYANNFVALNIEGLEFSRSQRGKEYTPPGDNASFLKKVRLQDGEGTAQIRFYLGGVATPADAQVVPLDSKIVVEIIKPLWKIGGAGAGTDVDTGTDFVPDEGGQGAGGEDNAENGGQSAGGDHETADGGQAAGDQTTDATADTGFSGIRPAGTPDGNPPEQDPGQVEVPPMIDLQPPTTDVQTPTFVPGPAYTLFDLDKVPVNQLDIRGMPFDEALVQLAADSGFNVVVGPGIDDAEVNLSFTQKDISLKSAMDLLCFAYDLEYTLDDDAIVFRAK